MRLMRLIRAGLSTAALFVLALGAASGEAAAAQSWTDPAGDSSLAPDVRLVNADWTADAVSFAVIFNQERLYGGESIQVFMDVDLSGATGDRGADYAMTLNRHTWSGYSQALSRWTSSGWEVVPSSSLTWYANTNGVAGSVARSEIGSPAAGVDFWVYSIHEEPSLNRYYDSAPDHGWYELRPPSSVGGANGTPTTPLAPLLGPRRARVRSGRIRLRVGCPSGSAVCSGKLVLRTRSRALLGRASYVVAPGAVKTVRLKLTKAGRRRVARQRQVRAVLHASWAGGVKRRAITIQR